MEWLISKVDDVEVSKEDSDSRDFLMLKVVECGPKCHEAEDEAGATAALARHVSISSTLAHYKVFLTAIATICNLPLSSKNALQLFPGDCTFEDLQTSGIQVCKLIAGSPLTPAAATQKVLAYPIVSYHFNGPVWEIDRRAYNSYIDNKSLALKSCNITFQTLTTTARSTSHSTRKQFTPAIANSA